MSLADAAVLFVCIAGFMMFILGFLRYPSRARKTVRGLGSYVFPEDAGRFPGGIVATLAASSALDLIGADSTSKVVVAGIVGCLVAGLPATLLNPTLGVFGLIGLAGLAGTVLGVGTDVGCTGVALLDRLGVLVVLAVAALVGAGVATMQGRLRSAEALALFATLDILIFLEQPLGVWLFGQGWAQTIIPIVAAALLGYGGAAMPGLVIGLGALGVGFAVALAGAGYGTMCSSGQDFVPLTMLIVYGIGYVIVRKVVARKG